MDTASREGSSQYDWREERGRPIKQGELSKAARLSEGEGSVTGETQGGLWVESSRVAKRKITRGVTVPKGSAVGRRHPCRGLAMRGDPLPQMGEGRGRPAVTDTPPKHNVSLFSADSSIYTYFS